MTDQSSLQSYLPRLVRYWDEQAAGRLHRSIEGSLVFVDISGFTKMSERLARHGKVGAEEVTDVIDDTFARLLPEAYMFGANLLKFGGDALLLMFTDEGHAPRAVAGADAMRAKLREVGTFQTTAGKVSLRMSVGVHSGLIDFFLLGESHRELIVAGPAASRIAAAEGAADAGQVLLTSETAEALSPEALGEPQGPGYLLRRAPGVTELPIQAAVSPDIDLSQFIPTALRATLAEATVEPEHRPTVIAFIHYGQFDQLLQREGGEAAGRVLHDLVDVVQQAADQRGVTFLATDVAPDGGKFILTAGVPDTTGNDSERMLLALREITGRAPSELPLQIGVNRGPVFAGAVGPHYRRTYTVMGDAVNLAARLMAHAPPGEIYTVRPVLDASRTTFHLTEPEPFQVKGKRDPIQAFSVGDPAGSQDRSEQSHLPLIGRDAELQSMLEAWSACSSRRGRTVELVAEVGMGKSRLLEEFVSRAGPHRVLRSECRLYQSSTSYFPFRALLSQLWGLPGSDPEADAEALVGLVTSRAPDLAPWLSLLGPPLGLELEESKEVAELDDQFRPARTRATVEQLMKATVSDPTLLLIEDTHWMDDASGDLLSGLIAASDDQPWMFVVTRRPVELGFTAPDTDTVTHLELAPLTLDQARQMIVEASADTPLLPHQVELLAARADGRPLFLLELLQALRDGSDVETMPHSVEGLIGARIDQLPRPDRHLLRRLSVLGTGFQLEHTTSILSEQEKGDGWQTRALRRLNEFLTIDRREWIQFRNGLIRDVAYGGLPFKTRLDLHARIGESIRRAAGDHPESQAELLSLHFFQARQWDDAWRFSRLAGDTAKSVYANQTAAAFYQRALTSSRHLEVTADERADVAEALGDVLVQAGLYDEALDSYRRALQGLEDKPVRQADIVLKRAQVKMRKGSYSQALRDAARGIRLVGSDESPVAVARRARLMAFRSTVRMAQQRPRDAVKTGEQAVSDALQSGERAALARAYANLDWAHFVMGQPEKAVHSPEAVEIYESLGLLDRAADVVNNMAGFAYYLGDWNESITHISRSREMSLRAGNDVQAAMSGVNLGELLVSQGKLIEAEPILAESLRVLQAAGDRDNAVNAELQLARLAAEKGQHELACGQLARVRHDALELGQTHFAYEASLYRAACLVRMGATADAMREISDAAAKAGEDAPFFEAKRARTAASALLEMGNLEEAYSELEKGLVTAQDLGLVYDEALIRMDRLAVAERTGRIPDEEEVRQANRLLDRLGVEQAAALI